MAWYQEWFGEEYLELYSHRDENEAREQVAFFRRQCGDIGGPILDLACGMGRHIQELTALGYRAIGCDLSYTMLRTGRAEYGPMPMARPDMRHLPFFDDTLPGLVNFFISFGSFADGPGNLEGRPHMSPGLAPD